jgi:ribosomal protein S18 acetylase RimI-like enzyme
MSQFEPRLDAATQVWLHEVVPPNHLTADDALAIAGFGRGVSGRRLAAGELAKYPRQHRERAIIALARRRPVGYLSCRVLAHAITVQELAVDPARRRQGVGRRLLWSVLFAATAAQSVVEIAVDERDVAAQVFCRAFGFAAASGRSVAGRLRLVWRRPADFGGGGRITRDVDTPRIAGRELPPAA